MKIELSFNPRTGRIEKTGTGPLKGLPVSITIDEAKELWENRGNVPTDWNLAFGRLARQFKFDVDAAKAFYAPVPKEAS